MFEAYAYFHRVSRIRLIGAAPTATEVEGIARDAIGAMSADDRRKLSSWTTGPAMSDADILGYVAIGWEVDSPRANALCERVNRHAARPGATGMVATEPNLIPPGEPDEFYTD